MEKWINLLSFLVIVAACVQKEKQQTYDHPRKVVVAGKIANYDPGKQATISVNRLGLSQEQVVVQTDSTGVFHAVFELYRPTDAWVGYRTNFLVLVHPGDSLYVEFDGQYSQRPQLLEHIRFAGDAVKQNKEAAHFQQLYFSNPLYTDWDAKSRAVKEYDMDAYLLYLDSIKIRGQAIYDQFVNDVSPSKEVAVWAAVYLEEEYYDKLEFYPGDHRRANDLNADEWDVPIEYYDKMLERLPIEEPMLISGYAMSNFINRFHYGYARERMIEEEKGKDNIQFFPGGGYGGESHVMDSVVLYGIMKHTPDSLLRQMVLTEYFMQDLSRSAIDKVERFRDVIDTCITEPFLYEPLIAEYEKIKNFLENPQLATDAILHEIADSEAGTVINELVTANKGKVLYIDFWGTWCGPCIAEMPRSKQLMGELDGKDVTFVYICIDSEQDAWKAKLSELGLGGQHYFFNMNQSRDIRQSFDIKGIPFYVLMDKNGVIVDKGSHLRPGSIKPRIEQLLAD